MNYGQLLVMNYGQLLVMNYGQLLVMNYGQLLNGITFNMIYVMLAIISELYVACNYLFVTCKS